MNNSSTANDQLVKPVTLKCSLVGVGFRALGFHSFEQFAKQEVVDEDQQAFNASLARGFMPAREQRRAPVSVKLALEVANQACVHAGIQASACAAVFVSGIGDADTLNQLYEGVSSDDKQVSPIRFHNSVHNAASGYWSISGGSEHALSFISAGDYSITVGLLEAIVQASTTNRPVLLVNSDIKSPENLQAVHASGSVIASAFLLTSTSSNQHFQRELSLDIQNEHCPWPVLSDAYGQSGWNCTNPAARALSLLAACADESTSTLQLPLSAHTCLRLTLSASV